MSLPNIPTKSTKSPDLPGFPSPEDGGGAKAFEPSCPSEGIWYACAQGSGSQFAGCCTQEACDGNGCPLGALQPATFNPAYFASFKDLGCPSDSQFYTCNATTPPFWGCCKSDPCVQGHCPSGDLRAAYFATPEEFSEYSATGGPSSAVATSTSSPNSSAKVSVEASSASTSISSSSSSSASASSGSITNALTAPTSVPTVVVTSHKSNTGAIAGGAAGGVAVLAIIIGLVIYFARHAKKSRKESNNTLQTRLSFPPGAGQPDIIETPKSSNPQDSIPPAYTSPAPSYQKYHHAASPKPTAYELPSNPAMSPGLYSPTASSPLSQGDGLSRKGVSPTGGTPSDPFMPHRLSEAPGDVKYPVELDSAHHIPTAQTPQSPSSVRSSGANWTGHAWQSGPDRGLAIKEVDEGQKTGGPGPANEGT
ncbi:uncharacterized protein BDZ99DRAFT_550197 [Mytilinidion resinicola]|uniref:Uncharacterized protein n=1 Tax=Mytilinidion resinicola TaxID=574789 RepID=A0A6A6Z335_9PEZI|nr:uncharacterized protein BDZ99DRAFT_550197 [Mytilinidion resinicola]KAF2815410.1 hypothetical protein BDZ99DRAFT_550197 [Mytilinidion resinicola]